MDRQWIEETSKCNDDDLTGALPYGHLMYIIYRSDGTSPFLIGTCIMIITIIIIIIRHLYMDRFPELPSGKRLHNYGKSACLMDNSTMNGHFQ